jgi:N-acetylglucosamine kinase-like BadF-type ATPase
LKRPALLAVDAGGSKIEAAVLAKDGSLLGAARMDHREHDTGHATHLKLVAETATAAARRAGLDPEGRPYADLGSYCLAGADLARDDRRILRWLSSVRLSEQDLLRNDTFAVMRAGTERTWGVGMVSGTGINCCGVAPDGKTHRFPAVGIVSGDWGGGTDIGETALWYALRDEDGRGERTILRKMVPAHFGMKRPYDVMSALYFETLPEDQLAGLAPVVFQAAMEGDDVARSIVDRQADEVVVMVDTTIRKLKMSDLDPDVVLGGGIFHNKDRRFFRRIDEGIARGCPRASVTVLKQPPVVGAALLGLDRLGATRTAKARARAALTHRRFAAETLREKE